MVDKGEWARGGLDWEFGVNKYKLLYIGWINNKILLYSTENSIQYPVINHNEKNMKKNIYTYIYIYIYIYI